VALRLLFALPCEPFSKVKESAPVALGSRFYSRWAQASRAAEGEAKRPLADDDRTGLHVLYPDATDTVVLDR